MGSYCSVMNNTTGTMYCKYGANLKALEIAFAIIADLADFIPVVGEEIALVAEVGENVVKIIGLVDEYKMTQVKGNLDKWFKDHDYHSRSPNTEFESDKLSLSLVVSAYCATVIDLGGGVLQVQVGTMTCWSGATDGDVNRYNVTDCSWQTLDTSPASTDIDPKEVQAMLDALKQQMTFRFTNDDFLKKFMQHGTNLAANQALVKAINARAASSGQTIEARPGVAVHG